MCQAILYVCIRMNSFVFHIRNFVWKHQLNRNISNSPILKLKTIIEDQNDHNLTIYGEDIQSSRKKYLIKCNHPTACAICLLGIDIKHTDVLIINQFVRSDGCMLPRRVTGLCLHQQKRMSSLVTMAQKSGLISNLNPSNSQKNPKKRSGWKKYNKYFNENTIT